MLVTIASCGDGKCVWCQTTGEGVQATFKDGFAGFLCRKDFWAALKARSESTKAGSSPQTDAQTTKAGVR
jgi:hypothetical protein